MATFFSHNIGLAFKPFGLLHIMIVFITLLGAYLIYRYQHKLNTLTFSKQAPYWFASILLLNQVIFTLGYTVTGNFDPTLDLPLHYCYITGYIYIYMLYFNKKEYFGWLYYAVFMCTTVTLIWMNPKHSYDRYIFYYFTISHAGLFLMNLYLYYLKDYQVKKYSFIKAFTYSNILFILIYFYNNYFNTNYIMSRELPPFITDLYPWVTIINVPIFWLELAGLIMCLLAYLVTKTKKN